MVATSPPESARFFISANNDALFNETLAPASQSTFNAFSSLPGSPGIFGQYSYSLWNLNHLFYTGNGQCGFIIKGLYFGTWHRRPCNHGSNQFREMYIYSKNGFAGNFYRAYLIVLFSYDQ